MNPSKVASALREIARRIDQSKSPSRSRVAATINSLLKRMASSPTLVLMQGPWGWMGYEVADPSPNLVALIAQANQALFGSGTRGSLEIVTMKPEMSEEDGQWTPVSGAEMDGALTGAIAGDEEAMVLH